MQKDCHYSYSYRRHYDSFKSKKKIRMCTAKILNVLRIYLTTWWYSNFKSQILNVVALDTGTVLNNYNLKKRLIYQEWMSN